MRTDARRNRDALIAAAWRLFSEQGPEVPLRSIAQEAGVGIATLYRHFPTRDELLLGVVDELRLRVERLVHDCLLSWAGDPGAAWERFARSMAELRLGALIAQMAPVAATMDDFGRRTGVVRRANLEAVESVLVRARAEHLVRDDLDASHFFAALAVVGRPLPEPAADLLPDDPGWMVEVLLRGLAPQDAPTGAAD